MNFGTSSQSKTPSPIKNSKSYLEFIKQPRIQQKLELVRRFLSSHETPFFVLETEEVNHAYSFFSRHLPFVQIRYAMKSNSHPSILNIVRNKGGGLDVASYKEIEQALENGFCGKDLLLANTHKDDRTLRALFEHKIGAFTYDSESELKRIYEFRVKYGYNHHPKSLLRLCPKLTSESLSNLQVDLSIKFGAKVDDAFELVKMAKELNLNPAGFAFHVGSNCYFTDSYVSNFVIASDLIKKLNSDLNLDMNTIDIGGGFPVDTVGATGVCQLDDFYATLSSILIRNKAREFEVLAEPGRGISGSSGTLTTKIICKKIVNGENWLILNDGVYGCYNPIIMDHGEYLYFPVSDRFLQSGSDLIPYTLAGPTCDSIDILARNVLLPKELECGDALFTVDIGAYSQSAATNFNGFQIAKCIVVEDAASQKNTLRILRPKTKVSKERIAA